MYQINVLVVVGETECESVGVGIQVNDTGHVVVCKPAFCADNPDFFSAVGVERPRAGLIAKNAETTFRQIFQGKSNTGRSSTRQSIEYQRRDCTQTTTRNCGTQKSCQCRTELNSWVSSENSGDQSRVFGMPVRGQTLFGCCHGIIPKINVCGMFKV